MNKILYTLLCFLLLGGSASLYSQSDNVELILPGSDAVSGFQVLRADSTMLFRVAGDGSLLVPGMTGAARRAIVLPVTGMVVFQNDETVGLYYYDGTDWRTLPLGSVTTATISNGAVTGDKIAVGTITGDKIATSTITGDKIVAGTVTGDKIAAGAVTTGTINPIGATSGQVLQYNGSNVVWGVASGTVNRNATLTGDGSSGSPLGINLGNSNTWTANQTFAGTFLITSNARIAMTNSDNNARDIRFQEPSGTGSQYIGWRAPSVTNNGNYVFPSVVGSAGQVLTINTSNGIDSATTYWSTPTVAAGSVGTTELADGAVTTAKILDSTITTADISPTAAIPYSKLVLTNSIQNGDIVANAITTSKVANGTVTTSKLADSAVSGLKLLTYAVTNRHLAAGAVTTDKIDPTGATTGQVLQYNGTNVVWGTPSGSSTVNRNATLTGDGSSGSPLGINLGNSNTWTANQTFGGTFLITSNARIAMTNSDNNARDIRFQEPSGTGSQYIGLRAPSVSNNGNYVLPAVVGSVGQVLTLQTSNGIDSATTYWTTPSSSVGAGSVGTTELADGAVTTAKILDSTITTADISPTAAIPYSKLVLTNSIQNGDIVANAITTSKVANGTVTTSKLADSAVSGLKLLTYAVTNRHLAGNAVTGDKIDPSGATSGQAMMYNGSSVGWGNPGGFLPYAEFTAANAGVSINTASAAVVVIRAGASTGFNIQLPNGTNGRQLMIYNSDGNTATVNSGNVLNAQTSIPSGTMKQYIWVTTNSTSGWVGQ